MSCNKFFWTGELGIRLMIHISEALWPYCAVSSMLVYLAASDGAADVHLFRFVRDAPLRRDTFIGEVHKLRTAAHLSNVSQYNGHSFRIGATTTATGTPEWLVWTLGCRMLEKQRLFITTYVPISKPCHLWQDA